MLNRFFVACFSVFVVLLGVAGCTGKTDSAGNGADSALVGGDSLDGERVPAGCLARWCDSTDFARIELEIEYYAGDEGVADMINRELLDVVDRHFALNVEGERTTRSYAGKGIDWNVALRHYAEPALKRLSGESRQQNADMGSSDSEMAGDELIQYFSNLSIGKGYETERAVVFTVSWETYYGGAHPGSGSQSLVFAKCDGHCIGDLFVRGAEVKLQGLIREGLVGYFRDCGMDDVDDEGLDAQLMVDDDVIPLPVADICPSAKGLTFTYQQYEIACYAAGMPSFTLPYESVLPYMTREARTVLCGN